MGCSSPQPASPPRTPLELPTLERPAGAALCNLLNLQVTDGAGNMSVWVGDDASQIVRTHAPDALPADSRPRSSCAGRPPGSACSRPGRS